MAYNINDLDNRLKNYLEVNKDELITKAIFNSNISRLFNIQTGVTSEKAIVRLDSTVNFAELGCSFNPTGTDKFTNRMLTPSFITVNKVFCDKDLLKTWAHADVTISATGETMPFEQQILENNTKIISAEIEKLLWIGDKTSGTGNMAFADGIYTIAKADADTHKMTKGSDNLMTRIQKIWMALDPAVADSMTLVTSVTNYKSLIVELMNANMYHVFEQYDGEYRMRLPFANIDIIGIEALEGKDVIMAVKFDELYYGVGLEGDAEDIDMFYSRDDRNFKFVANFVVATNYAFSENVWINE